MKKEVFLGVLFLIGLLIIFLGSDKIVNANPGCNSTIISSTVLDGDMTCAINGLIVSADNVVIDCDGHWINYTGDSSVNAYGVYSNYENTTVKNCKIGNYPTGIYYYYSNNGFVLNNFVSIYSNNATDSGIFMDNSDYNLLFNNTIRTTDARGFYIYYGDYNNVSHCDTASETGRALYTYSTHGSNFEHTIARSNSGRAFYVYYTYDGTISNVTGISTDDYGFATEYGEHNVLRGINGTSTSSNGIYILDDNDTIRDSFGTTFSSSGSRAGINLYGGYDVHMDNCTGLSYGSLSLGMRVAGPVNNYRTIINNSRGYAYGGGSGLLLSAARRNTIDNSIFTSASGYAISLSSSNNSFNNVTANNTIFLSSAQSNNFTNVNVSGGSYGYYISQSSENLVRDCTRLSGATSDVRLSGLITAPAYENTFLNCSYSSEDLSSYTKLFRKWYHKTYVNDSSGNDVSGAMVNISNSSGLVRSLTTDSNGLTPLYSLTEYVNGNGTKTYYSDYIINASYGLNTSSSKHQNITLLQNVLNAFLTILPYVAPTTDTEDSNATLNLVGGISPIYTIKADKLTEGQSRFLRSGTQIKLNFNNQSSKTLDVLNVSYKENIVKVEINGKQFTFSNGSSDKVDVNEDGIYDLQLSVEEISSSSYARINFKEIHEPIVSESQESVNEEVMSEGNNETNSGDEITDKRLDNLWIYILAGFILISIVLYFLIKAKTSKNNLNRS